MIFTFSGISDGTSNLVDDIADSSEQALEEMEKLLAIKPRIKCVGFSDDLIGKATFDSLRFTTGKDFLFESDDFEKNLLVSQLKVLRVISHLALQLEEIETNNRRKTWLNKLAPESVCTFIDFYQEQNLKTMMKCSVLTVTITLF